MECELCPIMTCPHVQKQGTFLSSDIVNSIQKNTVPFCFHCGKPDEREEKHSGKRHSTWKPICNCLNKSTIRIVTGGNDEY